MPYSEDYLAHYGVKGMKWGIRKARKIGQYARYGAQLGKAGVRRGAKTARNYTRFGAQKAGAGVRRGAKTARNYTRFGAQKARAAGKSAVNSAANRLGNVRAGVRNRARGVTQVNEGPSRAARAGMRAKAAAGYYTRGVRGAASSAANRAMNAGGRAVDYLGRNKRRLATAAAVGVGTDIGLVASKQALSKNPRYSQAAAKKKKKKNS